MRITRSAIESTLDLLRANCDVLLGSVFVGLFVSLFVYFWMTVPSEFWIHTGKYRQNTNSVVSLLLAIDRF